MMKSAFSAGIRRAGKWCLRLMPGVVLWAAVAGEEAGRMVTDVSKTLYADTRFGWEWVSVTTFYSDCDFCEHRFEARKSAESESEGATEVLVRKSAKSLQFLQAVHCPQYSVVFFSAPYLTPGGNVILGWKIAEGKKPVLIFRSPHGSPFCLFSELQDVRAEGALITGRLMVTPVPDRSQVLKLDFCLSEDTEELED